MKMYRVSPKVSVEQLLEVVRTKGQFPYPSKDFACRASALAYACWIALRTGKQPDIKIKDPDQYDSLRKRVDEIKKARLRERVAHIMGVEQ